MISNNIQKININFLTNLIGLLLVTSTGWKILDKNI